MALLFVVVGFVGVAPVATHLLTSSEYSALQFPCLFIFGERDRYAGEDSKQIAKPIPNHGVVELQKAGHAAYMNQPEAFHRLLENFMKLVDKLAAGVNS